MKCQIAKYFFWFSLLFKIHYSNYLKSITLTVTDKQLTPQRKLNTPLFKVNKNLRFVDTAVVEDQIHTGELLPCLLGLDIQFYHTLVTCEQSQLVTTSCLTVSLKVCLSHFYLGCNSASTFYSFSAANVRINLITVCIKGINAVKS